MPKIYCQPVAKNLHDNAAISTSDTVNDLFQTAPEYIFFDPRTEKLIIFEKCILIFLCTAQTNTHVFADRKPFLGIFYENNSSNRLHDQQEWPLYGEQRLEFRIADSAAK